jgi:DNA (cytosine-5)-methyltransferase 1
VELAPLTHVSLFSGIGGIDLAATWAGFQTVAMCERDPFCQRVLVKNFPGVPTYEDVRTFPASAFRGVDLLTGGFPCQPFSAAGRRDGADDDPSKLRRSFEGLSHHMPATTDADA